MKKLIYSVIPVVLIISLLFTSCGSSNNTQKEITNPHDADSTFTVAIVQSDDSYTYSEMRKAFIARMRTLGYDESKMKFDIKNAMGDDEKLNQIVNELVNSSYDLIVPVSTKSAIAVLNSNNTIPSVFIGVTDPLGNGIATRLDSPDKNMTGTVYKNDVSELFVLSTILTPNVRNIGIIYSKGNSTTENTVATAKTVLNDKGFNYEELVVDSSSDIAACVTDLFTRTDAILIPEDTIIDNRIDEIVTIALSNNKYILSSSETAVKSGAFISVSSSATTLGKNSAQLADKLLQGNKISTLAISEDQPVKFISKTIVSKMKIDVPQLENSQLV